MSYPPKWEEIPLAMAKKLVESCRAVIIDEFFVGIPEVYANAKDEGEAWLYCRCTDGNSIVDFEFLVTDPSYVLICNGVQLNALAADDSYRDIVMLYDNAQVASDD